MNCYQAQTKIERPLGKTEPNGAIQRFYKIWEWAKQKLTREEINNKLLIGTYKDGRTAWHYAAKRGL